MFSLNCNGKLLMIDKPIVMGIINLTSDSFYKDSRTKNIEAVLVQAKKMLYQGAAIIDIGAQSTRPGSTRISAKEEMEKVLPAVEIILKNFPDAVISVDTYHAEVAKTAVDNGVAIVNDISAGNMDKNMIETVARLNVPYVCMHMKGTPETMQQHAGYENIIKEILDFFIAKNDECKMAGIKDIIIDPGFGFAKTIEQNFKLLKELSFFKMLDKPILAGISRKSTIYKTLGTTAEDALNGTTVLNTLALQGGANILRVHDVKEAKEAITLFNNFSAA